jgi:Ni,Fe-hydrogenase III large subunit
METTVTSSPYISIKNQEIVNISRIPVIGYDKFYSEVISLMNLPHIHCVNYFAYEYEDLLKFICCLADDQEKDIKVLSHEISKKEKMQLPSITREIYAMHIFEREISENFGLEFIHSPWAKPVRYAFNRANKNNVINNYPFYKIQSDELHEVGVGPIHAGVIEPGHFRFLCNGETVLHLEIQLGWQHRGVEDLFLKKSSLLQRTILSESIAGDTAVGHSTAFVTLMESMSSVSLNKRLEIERTIALELERIAMHIGDLGNMNIGLAYQLASSVFGTLRTPVINYTQTWCGNRFGKGLNRVGGTHYPLTEELIAKLEKLLDTFEKSFTPMSERLFSLSSALMRMENIGKVSQPQMQLIGAVGMTARMTGIPRDVRISHPFSAYKGHSITSDTLENGDVWARAYLRKLEIENSVKFIRHLISELKTLPENTSKPLPSAEIKLATNSLGISLVEGWRGETCHCAITDDNGVVMHYKVKDPSMHNWMALALSLRDLEISDFPINNKSYNLSYCGHDL